MLVGAGRGGLRRHHPLLARAEEAAARVAEQIGALVRAEDVRSRRLRRLSRLGGLSRLGRSSAEEAGGLRGLGRLGGLLEGGSGLGDLGRGVGVDLELVGLLLALLLAVLGRVVLGRAVDAHLVGVGLQEGERLVDVEHLVLAGAGAGDVEQAELLHHDLEHVAALLQVHVAREAALLHHQVRVLRRAAQSAAVLHDGVHAVALGLHVGQAREQRAQAVHHLLHARLGRVAVLAQHEAEHLHEDGGQLGLVHELQVHGHGLAAHLVVDVGVALALLQQLHHGGGHVAGHHVARRQEQLRDGLDVPRGVGREALRQVVHARDQQDLEVLVVGGLQEVQHLVDHHLHVVLVADRKQQVDRLALQRLVVARQAVHHRHLVVRRHRRVLLHHLAQRVQAQVLQVRHRVVDEERRRLARRLQQVAVRVDAHHAADALVADRVPDGRARVRARHRVGDHGVHLLRGGLVAVAQARQQADDLDLHPRGGNVVVVVVARQAHLDDLLLDAHQRGNQALRDHGIVLADVVQQHHARRHDGRVGVAQQLEDVVVQVRDARLVQLVEAVQGQQRSLAHELALVGQQVRHGSNDGGNHFRGDQHRRGHQRVGNLRVVVRRHILLLTDRFCANLLEHVNNHKTELVLGADAAGSGKVAHLLQVHVRVGRQLAVSSLDRRSPQCT